MDLAKNLTIRSQEAELAFLLEARRSRLEGKDSFRVKVHKLTARGSTLCRSQQAARRSKPEAGRE